VELKSSSSRRRPETGIPGLAPAYLLAGLVESRTGWIRPATLGPADRAAMGSGANNTARYPARCFGPALTGISPPDKASVDRHEETAMTVWTDSELAHVGAADELEIAGPTVGHEALESRRWVKAVQVPAYQRKAGG
jgi:hypothetical protein